MQSRRGNTYKESEFDLLSLEVEAIALHPLHTRPVFGKRRRLLPTFKSVSFAPPSDSAPRSDSTACAGARVASKSLLASASEMISHRPPRSSISFGLRQSLGDVGMQMSALGVLTNDEERHEIDDDLELQTRSAPDAHELEERWQTLSQLVRRVGLLVDNLHEPIDQRISFNRFVDALEAGEEAADAPPMSGEAFERVRAAVDALQETQRSTTLAGFPGSSLATIPQSPSSPSNGEPRMATTILQAGQI